MAQCKPTSQTLTSTQNITNYWCGCDQCHLWHWMYLIAIPLNLWGTFMAWDQLLVTTHQQEKVPLTSFMAPALCFYRLIVCGVLTTSQICGVWVHLTHKLLCWYQFLPYNNYNILIRKRILKLLAIRNWNKVVC